MSTADRLARIGERLAQAVDEDPEWVDGQDRIVVLLESGDDGSFIAGGWDDGAAENGELVGALLAHVRALLERNGQTFAVITTPTIGGQG